MTNAYHIFNRSRVKQHRDRAAARRPPCDFLLKAMADRLSDRLSDIDREFPLALDLGAHHGVLAEYLTGKNGIEALVQSDLSARMIGHAAGIRLAADEEWLPFAAHSFDLVASIGSLHWVNDLPGSLIQIQRILKRGGLFIAMLPGGETLKELRQSFEAAELAVSGGLSPRVSLFVDVRDAGSLLQRAGFAEPVADSEILTVSYDHPLKLLHDLRAMGEASALVQGKKTFTPCSLMMLMADQYMKNFSDAKGRVTASFELVTLTGWKSG